MKSKLRKELETFFGRKGKLSRFDDPEIELSTAEEAEEFCSILEEHRHHPKHLARLIRAFQPDDPSDEVIEVLRNRGTPLLLELEPNLEQADGGFGDDRLILLKILAMYGTDEGADRVISVARSGYAVEGYLWTVIFGCFTHEHPQSERVFGEMRSSLPQGFMAISLLDAANQCAIGGLEFQHPFDSEQGAEMLRQWLRDTDPEHFSYAHSATAALPFIGNPPRDELLQLALDHLDPDVSVEAAWAAAKCGMERGIRELARFATQVNTAAKAAHLLGELGREDAIPAEAQDPGFRSMAEMVHWLSHPNEFGEPPARITLYDTRELFWPPTNDRRQVWLFRYEYPKSEDREEEDVGLGMVGSVTFALFGETTADLAPLEAYALHCCWELESADHPLAPEERSIEAGLEILRKFNALPEIGPRQASADPSPPEDAQHPSSDAEDPKPEDNIADFLSEMLAKAREKRASGKPGQRSPRNALKAAMREMMDAQECKLQVQVEQLRMHLVSQRQSAPRLRTSTRPGSPEVLEKPEVSRQAAALAAAGYTCEGVFEFEGIPSFALVFFSHSENGTIATITCGKELSTEFAAEYPEGRGFYVRDTAAPRGVSTPPWATYRYEPGKTVPELLAIFDSSRPPAHQKHTGAEAAARLASDFRRIQEWRMDRGGWDRAEVQAQLGIADPAGHEDQIDEACWNVREKWLYAWFKDKHPELAEELEDTLIIVHDELDSSMLFMLWAMGGGSMKVRREEFENAKPREAFKMVNAACDEPLTLIAQKLDGFPACFYRPKD